MYDNGLQVDVTSTGSSGLRVKTNLPISLGYVSGREVSMLRDTGCSGIVVKQELVRDEQMTNEEQDCMLADGSIVKVDVAEVEIDTPYYVGETEALCTKRPTHYVIIGNISGARNPSELNIGWKKVQREI